MQRSDEASKVFVGGLSWNTNADMLREHYSKFGSVIDAIVMKNQQTGKSRGFGFVTFSDPSSVELILTQKIHNIDGRNVDTKACNTKAAAMNKHNVRTNLTKTNKIFLGGLPNEANEELIRSIFSRYGLVKEVVIMMDPEKKRSRGFGFLTFDTEESVNEACKDHYVEVNGKNVECKRAEPRSGAAAGAAGGGGGLNLPGVLSGLSGMMNMMGGRGAQNGVPPNMGFGQGPLGQQDWGSGQWNQNGPPVGMNQGPPPFQGNNMGFQQGNAAPGFNQSRGGGGGGNQQGWGPQSGQGPSQQPSGPASSNYGYNSYSQQGPQRGDFGPQNAGYGMPSRQGGGPSSRDSGSGSSGPGFNYGYGDSGFGSPSGPGNQNSYGSLDSQQGYGGGAYGGPSRNTPSGGSGYHPYRR